MSVNCEDMATMSTTKLSLITLPFITSIAVGFLLFAIVQTISLLHDTHYNSFAYAISARHYTITIPKGLANPEVDITK